VWCCVCCKYVKQYEYAGLCVFVRVSNIWMQALGVVLAWHALQQGACASVLPMALSSHGQVAGVTVVRMIVGSWP
jgi:hypothetical protein